MAVALTIRSHVHYLRMGIAGIKAMGQAPGKSFSIVEHALKGDRAGYGPVVEEDDDASSLVQVHQVRMVGMNGGVGSFNPSSTGVHVIKQGLQGGFRTLTNAATLMRGKNGKQNAILCQQVKGFDVDRGFCEPHAFRFTVEAMLKIGNAPTDLRNPVPGVGERHDDMVVDLGQCGTVAVVTQHALPVRIANHAIGAGRIFFQPGEQGRPEVEADARVIVHDADDLVVAIHDARRAVGRIAFRSDAFVPVVVRGGGVLSLYGFEPGVFSRRLVEMPVNADIAFSGVLLFGHVFMIAAKGIDGL